MAIGHLESVPLRDVWSNEALDFTTWLADNLDFLGETLIVELSLLEQEAPAGAFSVDILAEDGDGNTVVIENQLERTDHDHLGKLITYLSNLDAKTAIWITSDPRPEHERAIQWLNEFAPDDVGFYLVKLEAYRIGESPPAPMFTIVDGPSRETKVAGEQKKELAERHRLRLDFWTHLLEIARERTSLHAQISPRTNNWISTGAGKSGLTYDYGIRMNDAEVELYIDRGEREWNKRVFDAMFDHKEKIEETFGTPLEWRRLDDKRASAVCYRISDVGGLQDREQWPEIQDAMVDAMIRLEKALRPEIENLPV